MSDGFSILITRPRGQESFQEVWLAHIPTQAEAVVAVQAAAGQLNDSKVEILNAISHSNLGEAGLEEGQFRKNTAATAGRHVPKDLSDGGGAAFNPDAPVDLAVTQDDEEPPYAASTPPAPPIAPGGVPDDLLLDPHSTDD